MKSSEQHKTGNCPVDLEILDDLGSGFGSVFVLFSGCHSVLESLEQ